MKRDELERLRYSLTQALKEYIKDAYSYDAEFVKTIREHQPQWFNSKSEKKKRELIKMPAGSPRPARGINSLGFPLSRYTSPSSLSYDPEFTKTIREHQPQWFGNSTDVKKREILTMPVGCPRPEYNTPLHNGLRNYTNPKKNCYDAEFDKTIRERQPEWFEKPINKKKRKIFEIPSSSKKPKWDSVLGRALRSYTSPKNSSYDPEFDKAIRKRQPGWFR